jgi:FG-GAP repeat
VELRGFLEATKCAGLLVGGIEDDPFSLFSGRSAHSPNVFFFFFFFGPSNFGTDVSISENEAVVVVGAHQEDTGTGGVHPPFATDPSFLQHSGAAYVIERTGSSWNFTAKLKASMPTENANFGYAVTASDAAIVVGARFEASAFRGLFHHPNSTHPHLDGGVIPKAGAAWIFESSQPGQWVCTTLAKSPVPDLLYEFGESVALSPSGKRLLIGTRQDNSYSSGIFFDLESDPAPMQPPPFSTGVMSGAAYFLERDASTERWVLVAYLKAPRRGDLDKFGCFVALSDGWAIVGAEDESSNYGGVFMTPEMNSAPLMDDTMSDSGAAFVVNTCVKSREARPVRVGQVAGRVQLILRVQATH